MEKSNMFTKIALVAMLVVASVSLASAKDRQAAANTRAAIHFQNNWNVSY